MDGLSYCNIDVNQPDTHRFIIGFIHNTWRLDMFRTSMVHPQECLQAVCCEFGTWRFEYHSIRPDVMRMFRVVLKSPRTKFATYSLQTLLRMDH